MYYILHTGCLNLVWSFVVDFVYGLWTDTSCVLPVLPVLPDEGDRGDFGFLVEELRFFFLI